MVTHLDDKGQFSYSHSVSANLLVTSTKNTFENKFDKQIIIYLNL